MIIEKCSIIHGDGKQKINVIMLNSRPNYYVIGIDGKIDINDEESFTEEIREEVVELIRDEFGTHQEFEDDFPAVNDDCGYMFVLGVDQIKVFGNNDEFVDFYPAHIG